MQILVLCQRRRTLSSSKNDVIETNNKIDTYMNDVFPNILKTYTYMSPCIIGLDENDEKCSDIKIKFDMRNIETQNWVLKHTNFYDVVLLNTCPFAIITPVDVLGFTQILKPDGSFFLIVASARRHTLINTLGVISSSGQSSVEFNGPPNFKKIETAKRYIPLNKYTVNAIERSFTWTTNANNTIPFLYKKQYSITQWIPVINWICNLLVSSKYVYSPKIQNIVNIMPRELYNFVRNISNYSLHSKKGNQLIVQSISSYFNFKG